MERFGALHVMVNNAGVSGKMQRSLLDDDLGDFERVMAINVKAVMAGTRDAARHMTETGGSIINLTSIGGIQAGGGVLTYRASKAAIIHFTKCAAIELAPYEIRVNCLAPGHIRTAIVASSAHGMDAEKVAKFEAGIRAQMRRPATGARGDRRRRRRGGAVLRRRPLALRHRHRAAGRRRHRGGASRTRRRLSPRIPKSIT